ncbi:MAG: BMP family lipoprotein [Brevinema sp.]
MKKIANIIAVFLVTLFISACGGGAQQVEAEGASKIGIVYSTGGKGDKSFNDAAFRGLEQAQKELGITFSEYEPKDPTKEAQDQLRQYAESGDYELIVAVGFSMKDSLVAVASQFLDQKFVIIDEFVDDMPNVASINFKEHEGSFLVGAIAGMMSKTGVIGFLGGVEVPLIQRFEVGYMQGARYINPDIKVLSLYVGGNAGFNDPASGKSRTETMIQQRADVVYHAAGATGLGMFQAAKDAGIYAIGVDSNQDDINPGMILTSMIKNVDIAIFDFIKETVNGNFQPVSYNFGVAEAGVGTTDFKYTKDIIGEDNLAKLEEIKNKIAAGEIIIKATR